MRSNLSAALDDYRRMVRPVTWVGLAGAIATADFLIGPEIRLNVLYAVPIGLAAWYHGRWWGTAAAVFLPLLHLVLHHTSWELPPTSATPAVNAGLRVVGFVVLAWLIAHMADQARKIRALEEFIRICMFCKRIRDENDKWQPVEQYISARTQSVFSSFICPDCAKEHYGMTV